MGLVIKNKIKFGGNVLLGGGGGALDGNPFGLSATTITYTGITLSWMIGSTNQDGHKIERSDDSGSTYSVIASVMGGTATYFDTTILAIQEYDYRVRAYKGSKYSSYSNVAIVTADDLWSSYWMTRFTGVPIEYSNNALGGNAAIYLTLLPSFRSMVLVNGVYHFFGEMNGTHPVDWFIAKRTSNDGLHFDNLSAALLAVGASGEFDEFGQADPTVIYDGVGDWNMWFDALTAPGNWHHLGYATSTEGKTWSKYGSVLDRGATGSWDDSFVHHPACIKHNGVYYLFYAGASNASNPYKIGLATSVDKIHWAKEASNPVLTVGSAGEFDSAYIRPSCPVLIFGTWYMWYWGFDGTDHSMGLASSPDLIHWTKKGKVLTGANGVSASNVMISQGNKDLLVKMWYTEPVYARTHLANITLPFTNTKLSKFTTSAISKYGDYVIGAADVYHGANYIYLHRLTVSAGITPDAIKVYMSSVGNSFYHFKVKLALYANNVNTPSTLLAVTEEKGWESIQGDEWNIFKFVTPPVLTSADYWIGIWSNQGFTKSKAAGGSNNHGILSLDYGAFPNPITATTSYGYNDFDMFLINTRTNVWEIALTPAPVNVYFNTVKGNNVASVALVDSEYDWCWVDGKLFLYSDEVADLRYQITYD